MKWNNNATYIYINRLNQKRCIYKYIYINTLLNFICFFLYMLNRLILLLFINNV